MSAAADSPRAVVVVVAGDQRLRASIDHDTSCDLGLVDRLLWLRVIIGRLGWTLSLEDADEDLIDLLELVGMTARLTAQ